MSHWPDKLFIYEINTWVWLNRLSRQYKRNITLANVPDEALDELTRPNIDVIWLMGVWKRSEYARKNALKYKHEYVGALPDLTDEDIIGSAYSIGAYEVDERIGGREGLAKFRSRLKDRGIKLLLDYVPNHIAIDHEWVSERPDFLISGKPKDAKERPSDFFRVRGKDGKALVLAHGRDPYFPGWSDTAQLNAFNHDLRNAVKATLLDIASQCDGVRCDMAMLVMNEIFAGTWHGFVNGTPKEEYWPSLIGAVREKHQDFLFIAEVYWGKEYAMLMQGFDFAYDKTLYDRIMEGDIQQIRMHLLAPIEYQRHMLRFIENHDEPRAFERLGAKKSRPAATLICTLPGACLLHDGQFTGARVKLPVQIMRGPDEPVQDDLREYYHKLLVETRDPIYQYGQFYLFETKPAGEGDKTFQDLLAYGWREHGKHYRLIVVNMTDKPAYARIPLGFWSELAGKQWVLHDVDDGSTYERDGDEMTGVGLFVILEPYDSHIFRFEQKA